MSNVGEISWGLHSSLERERKIRRRLFASSIKHEIRHFHVEFVQWRPRIVQKSVLHVQSCFLLNQPIECFHMTSRRPYWCPKTMKRQRERHTSNRFNKENNNFARASHSFVHFFDVFARLWREMPNFMFYGGRTQATTKFSFYFLTWIRLLGIQLQESSLAFDKESEME